MDSADQETIFSLRKKLNALERDKLEAVAASNQEVGQLTADIVRLVAQLEKGEVLKQNLEYELAKAKKDLAAERQLATNRQAGMTDAVAELQRKLEEMTNRTERLANDLKNSREWNEKEVVRLGCIVQDKENVILEQAARITTLEEARSEFNSNQSQKQRLVETLESEIERLQGLNRQLTDDARHQRQEVELFRERVSKSNRDLSDAYIQIQSLEEAVEAERANHNQAKFGTEVIQLHIKDMEAAVESEKAAKAEALANVERLSESVRQLQASLEDQRRHTSSAKTKLARSEKELDVYNRQLCSELADKKSLIQSLSGQLQQQQSELDQVKLELNKAKKKQVLLDEAYVSAVSELRLVLSSATGDSLSKKSSQARSGDMVSSKALSGVVQGVRELVQSYWKSNSVLETNVSTQQRQVDKLALEVKDCKEKLSAKYSIIKEAESSLAHANDIAHQSTEECKRLQQENSDLSAELQRLKQGLVDQQIQSQRLREQMLRLSVKCKTDEQTCCTFLTLLHQQLNSAVLFGGTDARHCTALQSSDSQARLASEQFDWNDIALLVNEQVSLLVAQHSRSQDKVYELERLLAQRDHVISKFEIANGRREQLAGTVDTQNQWENNRRIQMHLINEPTIRPFEPERVSAHDRGRSHSNVHQVRRAPSPKNQMLMSKASPERRQQNHQLQRERSFDSLQRETSSVLSPRQNNGASYYREPSSVNSDGGLQRHQLQEQQREDVNVVRRASRSGSGVRRQSDSPVSHIQSTTSPKNRQQEVDPLNHNPYLFNGASQVTHPNSLSHQSSVASSGHSRDSNQDILQHQSRSMYAARQDSGMVKLQNQLPAARVSSPAGNSPHQQLEARALHTKVNHINAVRMDSSAADGEIHFTGQSNQPDSDCSVVATALLYGCLTALSARASELAFQRNMLLVTLAKFEKFKQQVSDLVSAMTFSDQEMPEVESSSPRLAGGTRLGLTLRFRVAVIAVIASNRLSRGRSNSKLSFTSRCRLADVSASLPVYIGLAKSKSDDGRRYTGSQSRKPAKQLTWLHDSQLLTAVVNSVGELPQLLRSTNETDKVERMAQACFDSLISHLSSLLPSSVHVNRMGLIDRLNTGLLHVIHDKMTDKDSMHPYVRSEDILDGLQRCVLDFTNRLHCAELERHELRTHLTQLQHHTDSVVKHPSVSKTDAAAGKRDDNSDKYNSLLTQLTQALEREQTMQDVIDDQANRLKQLSLQLHRDHAVISHNPSATGVTPETGSTEQNTRDQQLQLLLKQVESLQCEKEALQENVRDAEIALKTASKDKHALASYLASVESALGCSGGITWPTDRHLPVQLGIPTAGCSSSRPGSNLSAVHRLVASFVEAHNDLIRTTTETQSEINSLKGTSQTVTPRHENRADETDKYDNLLSELSKSLEREHAMQETIQEHSDKLLRLDLQLAAESESLSSARGESVASLSDRAKPDYAVASAVCSLVQPQVTSLSLVTETKKRDPDAESLTSTKSSKSSKSRSHKHRNLFASAFKSLRRK